MFDLDRAIAQWRQQMRTAGIKSSRALEELDAHLREEVQREMQSGVDAPAAFAIAVERMGEARALKAEFAKVGEVMSARQRKINLGVCAFASILFGLAGISFLFGLGRDTLDFRARISAGAVFVSSAVILISWKLLHRYLPVLGGKRKRTAVCLAILSVGLGVMMLLQLILESASDAIWITALFGSLLLPLVMATSLVFGLEEAAYRKVVVTRF